MAVVKITQDNLQGLIDESDTLLVDFSADWCEPCRLFEPIFESVADNHADIVFGRCDIDNQSDIAEAFEIESVPTLSIFRDGILLFSESGGPSKELLEQMIEKVMEVDMDEVRREIEKESQ